jgi:hypothetical protein
MRACVGDPSSQFFLVWLSASAFIAGPMLGVALFTWIFPAVGFGAIGLAVFRGLSVIQALEWGEAALATWERAVETNTRINKQPVMEHHFSFTTTDGDKRSVTARALDGGRLQDDPQEIVLYDPKDPDSAVVLGAIPGDPRPTDDGNFVSTAPGGTRVVVLTTITIISWIVVIGGHIMMFVR